MITLTILGSTGSIGRNTLSIVENNLHYFKVIGLVANKNVTVMLRQCLKFNPIYAAMYDESSAIKLKKELNNYNCKTKILSGKNGIYEIANLDNVDQVMSAITGIAGLVPTLIAISKGKRILLANKESIIVSGYLFFDEIKKYGTQVLPVDSEHNAIFQCLPKNIQCNLGNIDLKKNGIKKIILTGSGGPFRNIPLSNLKNMTPDLACHHPNWKMGKKISVDSATMMNKGFEYIEARYLFNLLAKDMDVLIHPESILHSMVYYFDGSIIAQLSASDMKIPISYCMFYPDRKINYELPFFDFTKLSLLSFYPPDYNRYPCLKLAIDICYQSQAAVIILNAVNEIAVDSFLNGMLKFTDISRVNCDVTTKLQLSEPKNINEIFEIDHEARNYAIRYINDLIKLY